MHVRFIRTLLFVALLAPSVALAKDDVEYEVGGPLAGTKLPAYPTYHGEPAGKPGNSFGGPQLLLYPGSVENWRAYFWKYLPIRSFFDEQSQIANWVAPNLPGVTSGRTDTYAQALYKIPRHDPPVRLETREPAVEVVRLKAGDTIFDHDLGELEAGLYVLRVIGAVPTEQFAPYRRDLFVHFTINDRPDGGESTSRSRIGYVDQFYSVAEMYFHAPAKRRYHATLSVGQLSKVQLLVHNVSLDDALAGIERRAIKTKSNDPISDEAVQAYFDAQKNQSDEARKARLARDEAIWFGFPPTNEHWSRYLRPGLHGSLAGKARPGANGMTAEQIEETYGKWVDPFSLGTWASKRGTEHIRVMLKNEKLNLQYTSEDLYANRPLPDPFPIKDDGAGVSLPDEGTDAAGQMYAPICRAMLERIRLYQHMAGRVEAFLAKKSPRPDLARDGLVAFARFVYDFPTLDSANELGFVLCYDGPFGRQARTQRRLVLGWFLSWYTQYAINCELYDRLYPLIEKDQELAESIGRFIPWVKTPEDVVALFDAYLVQQTAKRILRYHYYVSPMDITLVAAVLGDKQITEPWMKWQYSRTFIYPYPPGGIQHIHVAGHDRAGIEYGTSSFYGLGENATRNATAAAKYQRAVGHTPFNLHDPYLYPKVQAASYWPIQMSFAGHHFVRIGDVTGPEKAPGHTLRQGIETSRRGWQWTKDAGIALMLKHMDTPSAYTSEQWAEIEQTAATRSRMPWLDQRSRFIPNWAGILETGQQHDDYRYRRGVSVRTGRGIGHHHHDTLDLQLAAHGLPLLMDGGQRPGYMEPPGRSSAIHNLVTIDNNESYMYAWVRSLSDTPGAQYLMAQAGEPTGPTFGNRQVTLIDIDEGEGSQPLQLKQQIPWAKLPKAERTANSYVFDVYRLNRGKLHRYNFHAMVNDAFEWNATGLSPAGDEVLGASFPIKPEMNFKGVAPQTLRATWRMYRQGNDEVRSGTEERILGVNYDPESLPKYVRLHMMGAEGQPVARGEAFTVKKGIENHFTCIGIENTPANSEDGSVFVSIIEPYVGDPILRQTQLLDIAGNESDSQRAVAVQVQTVSGHMDILFADGRPDRTRNLPDGVQMSGQFAAVSNDKQGLRLATLTGGTKLHTPQVKLDMAHAAYTAKIVDVDYFHRQFTIDAVWPKRTTPQLVEVGHSQKMTAYTLTDMQPGDGRTVVTTQRGADYYLAGIQSIESDGTVQCALPIKPAPGIGDTKGFVATDAKANRFWRTNATGAGRFKLQGDYPVNEAAFAPTGELRLWEYGPGDAVQQVTTASLVRNEAGYFELRATADVTLSLPCRAMEISTDGQSWQAVKDVVVNGGWMTANFAVARTADRPLYVRVK